MLKREFKYKDFNDEDVTETFYFNLTKPELIEMEVSYAGGMHATLMRIMESTNKEEILALFKRIILASIGEKSEDGRRFIKNEQITLEFTQTPAYELLFMELASDHDKAAAFVNKVMPADWAENINKGGTALAPPPPPAPQEVS